MDNFITSDKCAPGYTYSDNSCFTLEQLHKIIDIYNSFANMKIISKQDLIPKYNTKSEAIKVLLKYLKESCDDEEICLIKNSFLAQITEEYSKDVIRPFGPSSRFTWLSTLDINNVINQYVKVNDNFKFLGSVPIDFDDLPRINIKALNIKKLYDDGKHKIAIVFNTDKHYQSGSHWVAAYCDMKKFQLYYFDSVAQPPHDNVRKLICHIAELCYECKFNNKLEINGSVMHPSESCNYDKLPFTDIRYNKTKHQRENSECGVYCINFIIRMLKGVSFDEHNNTPISDSEINTCRSVYFTNGNFSYNRNLYSNCD